MRDKRTILRALLPAILLSILPIAPGAALAQDLCNHLDALIGHAQIGFVGLAESSPEEAEDQSAKTGLADASGCSVRKTTQGNVYLCDWAFPHRAKQAYDRFESLARDVHDCLGERAVLHNDQSVNHPDYYALRRFETDRASVSVSVKDKAALDRTYVFVGIQGSKAD